MLNEKYQQLKRKTCLEHTWGRIICITHNKLRKTHLNRLVHRICIFMCIHLDGRETNQIYTLINIWYRYKHPLKKKQSKIVVVSCPAPLPLKVSEAKNYSLLRKCRCGSLSDLYNYCITTTTKKMSTAFYIISKHNVKTGLLQVVYPD